jgi:hypothetical protein
MIGDIVPQYALGRAASFGRNKNTGGFFPWTTPGIHEVHTSFTGPQWAGDGQPILLCNYLVTTYPVPEGLTAVTVGLTRNQKSIEVIQFHGVAGKGSNIAGMDNLLPDTARLHDHLWILFPLVPGETMKEIYVIHR